LNGPSSQIAAGTDWVRLRLWPPGPRVFRKQIAATSPGLRAAGRVAVLDRDGGLVGWGLWHPRSAIAVRMLRRGAEPADDAWVRERAAAAVARRLATPELAGAQSFRVLHAEGDDFPGLVVDRYGPVLSATIYTATAEHLWELAQPILAAALDAPHWRLSFDTASADAEYENVFEKTSADCPWSVKIEEHGLRFEVDFRGGHKTGFFCDQRENRARFATLCAGRSVLDVCCYTGGFALNAAGHGATEVLAIDLDEVAVAQAQRNANLNSERLGAARKNLRFVHADAFSYLRTLQRSDQSFDVVVLDPPKFLRSRRDTEDAESRYHDLNKLGIGRVKPGGLLLTCSCSGMLPLDEFQELVRRAARGTGRNARLLRTTGAGPDHPCRLDFPEGAYLKALWLQVD